MTGPKNNWQQTIPREMSRAGRSNAWMNHTNGRVRDGNVTQAHLDAAISEYLDDPVLQT
jgi:hypothetical protein